MGIKISNPAIDVTNRVLTTSPSNTNLNMITTVVVFVVNIALDKALSQKHSLSTMMKIKLTFLTIKTAPGKTIQHNHLYCSIIYIVQLLIDARH